MNKRRNTDDDQDIVNTLVKKHKMADEEWPDEMTPEAAKRIEKLQEKWRKQDVENQRREAEEYKKRFNKPITLPIKYKNQMILLPQPDNKPLTVKEAKALGKLQDKLKRESEAARATQYEETRNLYKSQEPIIKAIKEQTEVIKSDKKPTRVQILRKRSTEQFRPRAFSTPGRSNIDVKAREIPLPEDDEKDVFEARETPLPEDDEKDIFEARETPLPEDDEKDVFEATTIPLTPAETDELQNRSIREFTENEDIGDKAKRYLASGNDRVFGIYYNFNNNKLAIGSQTISIDNNDIILDNTADRYVGTDGLWKLLTMAEIYGIQSVDAVGVTPKMRLISVGAFTSNDYENYRDILIKTNAIYQNYDPASRRPKSSQSWKWMNLISDIYKSLKQNPTASGKGLLIETNCPVQYKYIDDYGKLCDRIKFIQAEEEAGNNNFHNEKIAIVNFISDRMKKLIAEPEGIAYINQCLTALPENKIEGGKINTVNKRYRTNLGLASDRKKSMTLFHRTMLPVNKIEGGKTNTVNKRYKRDFCLPSERKKCMTLFDRR